VVVGAAQANRRRGTDILCDGSFGMMYEFVWALKGDEQTEELVPMLWHGKHIRRMGWSNPIVLVFMEGLGVLSSGYRKRLEELGYEILDCQALAGDIVGSAHPKLRSWPLPDKYWFLRWSVLAHLFETRAIRGQAIHIDGDVVFASDPSELERDVAGKTFILQGNPHFAVINTLAWFDVWKKELNLFLENRAAYVANALRERNAPTLDPRAFCNVCAYGADRFHDQAMIEYLIAAGRLPQARTPEVFNSQFYWMQNPLMPGEWFDEQRLDERRLVVEEGPDSLVGGKRLAYYHFLTGFIGYCKLWLEAHRRGTESSIDARRFLGKVTRTSAVEAAVRRVARSFLRMRRVTKRRAFYEVCFRRSPHTGNLYVTDIVNSCWGSS
jgi:hypothetical protein